MSIFNFAVALSSITGLIMVIGGIFLIYKGALVLASTDSNTALSIEWKQDFRLNTQAPGIAFFLIGLIFSCIAIFSARPPEAKSLTIKGKVISSEIATVRMISDFGGVESDSDGSIEHPIHPHNEKITLVITAPGYKEEKVGIMIKDNKKVLTFEDTELERKITERIEPNKDNIVSIDENETLASADTKPRFGVAQ